MKIKVKDCFYFLSLFGAAIAWAQPTSYDCQSPNLITAWAFADKIGDIEDNNVSLGSGGGGSLDFLFRSRLDKPITGLAFVLEYFDRDGDVVERVPAVGQVVPGTSPSPPNVLSPSSAWSNELAPSESVLMTGIIHGIRTGHCPVRARVTFVSVHFADGTNRTLAAPDWRLDASPRLIPNLAQSIPDLPGKESTSVLGKLKISASGDVLGITTELDISPDLLRWIRDRVQSWKFYPALLNSRAVDSELPVLIFVQAKGTSSPEATPHLDPVTVIRFGWSSDLSSSTVTGRWIEFYGVLTDGTALGSPLAQFLSTQHH